MENRPLGQIVADPILVERRFSSDVQSFDLPLQQDQARIYRRRILRPAINTASKPFEPAGADVMYSKIS